MKIVLNWITYIIMAITKKTAKVEPMKKNVEPKKVWVTPKKVNVAPKKVWVTPLTK